MSTPTGRTGRHVLLSSVSSDAHTWNLVYLQLLLEEHDYDVTMLGACVPDELLLEACLEEGPDALVLSSVNGHGHPDGLRMVKGLRGHPRLQTLPVALGGKLGIAGELGDEAVEQLRSAGVDAVFLDDAAPEQLITWLDEVTATVSAPVADAG